MKIIACEGAEERIYGATPVTVHALRDDDDTRTLCGRKAQGGRWRRSTIRDGYLTVHSCRTCQKRVAAIMGRQERRGARR